MVAAIDLSIPVNNVAANEKSARGSFRFPAIELATRRRRITLARMPYQMVYRVYGRLPKHREVRPPLGLLYVAGALEEAGHEVRIIDAEPEMLSPDAIFDRIMQGMPDVVGFTATTPEIDGVQMLCRMLKRRDRRIVTMVGGSHISALPRQTLRDCPEIDYAVVGEGELSAVHVANHLPAERIIRSKDIACTDEVPLPARHLLDYRWYRYPWPGKGLVAMDVVESIRGCPFLCTFCSVRGVRPRARDPVKVVDEIEASWRRHGIRIFMFFDDTLTVNPRHVFALCDELIRRGLNKRVAFYANTRANTTTPEMLDKLIEAGVTEMSMGVESGSNAMLKAMKKGCDTSHYARAYRWMHERGLQTRASFIVGLPHETHETVRQSIDFAKKIDLMRCSVNILTPYPGTQTYQQALAGDGVRLLCADWREFKRWGRSVVETDELTAADLEWYQCRFLTEFYTQPKVLWYHFKQLLRGNFSLYFYRPIIFAIKNRMIQFLLGSRPPSWDQRAMRRPPARAAALPGPVPDIHGEREIPTGLEQGLITPAR